METQRKKLPEGVGRKIVEALKQQSVEITEVNDNNFDNYDNNLNIQQDDKQFSAWDNAVYQTPHIQVEQGQNSFEHAIQDKNYAENFDNGHFVSNKNIIQSAPSANNFNVVPQPAISKAQTIQTPSNIIQSSLLSQSQENISPDFDLPPNIEMLKRLIVQLPAGVTRQTGAQIIRQTMEAMGLSINSVLSEAQMVQESLSSSAKDSINTIEEYKNNIKILERKIQNYKKQADQLGELINLFISSDKKR